jgi:hypothetical protein
MSDTVPGRGEAPRAFRILGLLAVCVGVAALAAATFVLSYPGIHAIALQAGISPRLARGYPLVLDAMLIVVLAAVLALRGAGLPSKVMAWLTLLAVLGAAAGADALHAAKDKLPASTAEITAAVLPWVLVFLAFVLLLAILRHARLRRLGVVQSAAAPDILPGFRTLPGQDEPQAPQATTREATAGGTESTPIAAREGTATAGRAVLAPKITVPLPRHPDSAAGAASDDPGADETASGPALAEAESAQPAEAEPTSAIQPDQAGSDRIGNDAPEQIMISDPGADETPPFGTLSPAPAETAASQDADMPVFHRISSSPVPPDSG